LSDQGIFLRLLGKAVIVAQLINHFRPPKTAPSAYKNKDLCVYQGQQTAVAGRMAGLQATARIAAP